MTRPSAAQPKIVFIRLRPESFLDPEALLTFLRHELLHVADMVDPRFGYMKDLLASDTGPSYDAILRTRYRVVWDATIDGRLARKGWAKPGCREVRLKEFSRTFSMLNAAVTEAFSRWFDGEAHTHAAIMAFAQDPRGLGSQVGRLAGRCPICRFPTVRLDPDPARLSAAGRRELHADHPRWRLDEGLCSQCLDLYEASASGRRERRV